MRVGYLDDRTVERMLFEHLFGKDHEVHLWACLGDVEDLSGFDAVVIDFFTEELTASETLVQKCQQAGVPCVIRTGAAYAEEVRLVQEKYKVEVLDKGDGSEVAKWLETIGGFDG